MSLRLSFTYRERNAGGARVKRNKFKFLVESSHLKFMFIQLSQMYPSEHVRFFFFLGKSLLLMVRCLKEIRRKRGNFNVSPQLK